MSTQTGTGDAPSKYAVALFDGFQALDVFGPVDILNLMSRWRTLEFSLIAPTMQPVSTAHKAPSRIEQRIVPTHTYDNAPEDIEVLLVPGGMGTRDLENTRVVVDFIRARFPRLRYLLTVCTGSTMAAQAGVLDGLKATSNKKAFTLVSSFGPNTEWIREARWVVDGKVWTSSGISAGIDMMFAFIEAHYGEKMAGWLAIRSEYTRNKDSENDAFAQYPEED